MTRLDETGSLFALMPPFDAWRVFRIISEFVQGFETMKSLGPSVAFFGSSRMNEKDPHYGQAKQLAEKLVQKKFGIITGGGPGIMTAANEGARVAKGRSCGLCIDLPMEERPNDFIDRDYYLRFRYFFIRKVMFVRYAQAFVVFPGGLGTLDELFEALTLIQTKRIQPFPIYLFGKKYWSGLIQWLKETVAANHKISPEDLDLLTLTDDLDEIVQGIDAFYRARLQPLENF